MKAVLDTNVLVSAFIIKIGKSAQILKQINKFDLYLSVEIIKEIDKVLHYRRIKKKYKFSDKDINKYLRYLTSAGRIYKTKTNISLIKEDPDDDKFLALADEQKTDYIVSGDPHLTSLKKFKRVSIITPAQFLIILDSLE